MARTMELVRKRDEAGAKPYFWWRCLVCTKEGKRQDSRSLARTIGRRHVENLHSND